MLSYDFINFYSYQLPSNTTKVSVKATGSGASIFQVCYSFNINNAAVYPSFTITATILPESTTNNLRLQVCFAFITTNYTQSNMALAEISLPSGYTADSNELQVLVGTNLVESIETKNGDTVIVVYFEYLDAIQTCIEVGGTLTSNVADQKPSSISIKDYYDSSKKALIFYEPQVITQCDICDGDECVALDCAQEDLPPSPAEANEEKPNYKEY